MLTEMDFSVPDLSHSYKHGHCIYCGTGINILENDVCIQCQLEKKKKTEPSGYELIVTYIQKQSSHTSRHKSSFLFEYFLSAKHLLY